MANIPATSTQSDVRPPSSRAVSAVESGDDAVAVIYAAHHGRLLQLAYLLTGRRDVAEDVTADVFVRLVSRGVDGIDDPGAYLRRAVVNAVNSRWRRLVSERAALSRWQIREPVAVDDPAPRIDDAISIADPVWQALSDLPRRQRIVLVLRYFEDLSEAEIAEALGISRGTVKSTAARGLARLRGGLVPPSAVVVPAAA